MLLSENISLSYLCTLLKFLLGFERILAYEICWWISLSPKVELTKNSSCFHSNWLTFYLQCFGVSRPWTLISIGWIYHYHSTPTLLFHLLLSKPQPPCPLPCPLPLLKVKMKIEILNLNLCYNLVQLTLLTIIMVILIL